MADKYLVVVNVAGNVGRRSDRDITSNRVNAGEYDVTFSEDIDDWCWTATLRALDDTPQTAKSVTAELGAMGVNETLHIRTINAAGAATDKPFTCVCARFADQLQDGSVQAARRSPEIGLDGFPVVYAGLAVTTNR